MDHHEPDRPGPVARRFRLGLVLDYAEEGWPSMDLVGEMIAEHLRLGHGGEVEVVPVRPPFRRRAARVPGLGRGDPARAADRLLNRFIDYPRALRRLALRGGFDLFHLVDHSYAQVVDALPPGRAVVTCHDLDTFACLLEPERDPRPRWFRAMTRRILDGFRGAAAVACVSEATRGAILARGLVPADRLHVVPNGVPPGFSPEPDPTADAEAARLLGRPDPIGAPEVLHVGSTIPRKRIDVLLEVFAGILRDRPGARLVRVGGALTPEQGRRALALGVADAMASLGPLDRPTLAAVYRRATLLLLPSEAEGFGLPLAEAMASGLPALASSLPALHEVAGDAARFAPTGDVPLWVASALDLIASRQDPGGAWHALRAAGLRRSSRYRWPAHADRLMAIYRSILAL